MCIRGIYIVVFLSAVSLCVQAGDQPTQVPNTTTTAPTTVPPPTTIPPPTAPPTTPSPPTTLAPVTTTADPSHDTKTGNWTVSNGTVTCVLMQMAISSKIAYPISDSKNGTVELHIPSNAKANGSCAEDSQSIVLNWDSNELDVTFGLNKTLKMYYISNISLHVVVDNKTFPNISASWVGKTLSLDSKSIEFKTNFNQSYRCTREQNLPLHMKDFPEAVLVLSKVRVQAFHMEAPAVFGDAQDCELDTPDIVPIAVGCALAGLVLVVLVAYLIGRRRSQARGYLSIFLE